MVEAAALAHSFKLIGYLLLPSLLLLLLLLLLVLILVVLLSPSIEK
jgi:hypothetical protein